MLSRFRRRGSCVLLAVAVPLPASVQGQRGAVADTRDSAGIRIMEYSAQASPPAFSLRPTSVELGTTPDAELVRVVAALRMPNGKLVVADAGRRQLLRFSSNGTFERVIGREGSGPGEFVRLLWMGRHGLDSIATHDGSQFRYSIFTDSGFVRQAVLQKAEHLFQIETFMIGLLADGSPVVTTGSSISLGDRGPARTERQVFPVVRYHPDGRPDRLLGRYTGFEIQVSPIREGPRTGGFSRGLRLFGTTSSFGISGAQLIVADNSQFQFDVTDATGQLIRRVRRAVPRQSVLPSHLSAHADELVSGIQDAGQRARRRERYASQPHAPVFPAMDPRLMVDADERIWLGSFKRPGDREQTWWIFGVDGAMLGRVTVPASLTIMDAGSDYLLGVWRDADGMQTVRLYQLAPS
jgi:hypothetical protein